MRIGGSEKTLTCTLNVMIDKEKKILLVVVKGQVHKQNQWGYILNKQALF